MEEDVTENASKVTTMVPDVAAAIEDLLEQTSKVTLFCIFFIKGDDLFIGLPSNLLPCL